MKQFHLYSINYPGIFSLKPNVWFKFSNKIGKFAFFIEEPIKGIAINAPNNSLVWDKKGCKLEHRIEIIKNGNFILKPVLKGGASGFLSLVETDFESGRSFFEKGSTRLFLLLEEAKDVDISAKIKECLNFIFVVYSSNVIKSTILPINSNYLNESIIIYESKLELNISFDKLTESSLQLNLSFIDKEIIFAQSKFGIYISENPQIKKSNELKEISDEYFDVFELFSLGLMQMNHFGNYKLALLECFVAVEMLVTRITEKVKKTRGISHGKIKDHKKSVELSYKMDIELKLFFQFDKKEDSLLGQMVRARSIRNGLMHENTQVDEKEVRVLIEDINNFIFMLIEKDDKNKY
ncbi:hypothetical protein FF125_17410 [Aureibaculum algae]|uniref:ApeA N-terminal domain-containing protein n=1 Tax=Aureibaculum algae TaxID=2584122 RepID=A0A5B7TYA9_9FLAO|nr:hypothetical protein [Aureibaculum algae]QCX40136.1 hypothetical protein FF125_17410 [Aureibaculum algae]